MTTTIRRMAEPARPTTQMQTLNDGTRYRVWTDGSWRRDPARVRGKAQVKSAKRSRRLFATRQVVAA